MDDWIFTALGTVVLLGGCLGTCGMLVHAIRTTITYSTGNYDEGKGPTLGYMSFVWISVLVLFFATIAYIALVLKG